MLHQLAAPIPTDFRVYDELSLTRLTLQLK